MKALLLLCAVLGVGATSPAAEAIDEPSYTLGRQYEGFELRDYAPYLVAETLVPGPAEEAGKQGFRILATYLFGGNRGERKIAMAAPVTLAPVPSRISMSAPLSRTADEGGFLIQFKMPLGYTLASLPEPLDPQVKLREVEGGRFAVIRYSGSWSEGNYRAHLEQLQHDVAAAGLHPVGSPIYARYDAPFVPWFLRRNEIWLRLVEEW